MTGYKNGVVMFTTYSVVDSLIVKLLKTLKMGAHLTYRFLNTTYAKIFGILPPRMKHPRDNILKSRWIGIAWNYGDNHMYFIDTDPQSRYKKTKC